MNSETVWFSARHCTSRNEAFEDGQLSFGVFGAEPSVLSRLPVN
jgi:hypothetical protein